MSVSMTPDGGWQEAVILVHDLELWRELADHAFGWDEVRIGPVDSEVMAHWHLPDGALGTESVFQCGDEPQGLVRFMRITNVPRQGRVRAGALPWDTGGIFSLMVRSLDLSGVAANLMDHGFTAFTDPVKFEYGGRKLINVIMRGPDGISFGIYERSEPPLQGWPHIKQLSQPFNAMQIVTNRDEAYDFYHRVLGFGAFVHSDMENQTPKQSNFGIPINLTTQVVTKAAIMHPHGHPEAEERNNGRVELIEWHGLDGRDVSERAVPPNLGIMTLRFPVSDLAAKVEAIRAADWPLWAEPRTVAMAPYGKVEIASVRSPDGAILEFFQSLE